ncbi:MAG: hypothetical protein MHM6MM_006622 [Cercozoa sp. M6MM]
MEQYAREQVFSASDSLAEFDDAREVVQTLCEEYKAIAKPDYASYVPPQRKQRDPSVPVQY